MKNFKLDDRVEFHSTTSVDLDGFQGTILGIYSDHPTNKFWIVLLDNPLPDRKAVVMTDSCLKHTDELSDNLEFNKIMNKINDAKRNMFTSIKTDAAYDTTIRELRLNGYRIGKLEYTYNANSIMKIYMTISWN